MDYIKHADTDNVDADTSGFNRAQRPHGTERREVQWRVAMTTAHNDLRDDEMCVRCVRFFISQLVEL